MKRKLLFILSLFLIFSIFSFGENFPEKANKPKEEWKTIKANKKYVLNEMTSDIVDEIAKYAY